MMITGVFLANSYYLFTNTRYMKNLFLFFIFAIFLTVCSFSQNTTIKPGIGFNASDFSQNANGTSKAKIGYQIGGSIAFGKKLYFEPGVFYVAKSTEYTSSNSTSPKIDAQLSGIRVPVHIGLNVLGSEKTTVALRIFGGGSAFFITSTDELNKDSLNTTNWALLAGAGLDFWKLFIDMSYEWSMTDIQKDVSQIDLGKTRTFFFTAGIRINL